MILSDAVGVWAGTNGFRLMPDDPLASRPATLTATMGARGHLTSVAYTWEHPDDGSQEGLLVVGSAGDGDALTAIWADSWHQKPEPMTMTGTRIGTAAELSASYGGDWGWRIRFDVSEAESLRMRMDNVLPAGHDGAAEPLAYPVMVMDLRR